MKDLHIHSSYSDGELSVIELVQKIKEVEIDFFSITDHDTVAGCKELVEHNIHKQNNLKFVTGIELSASIDKGKCHILGYNIDIYNDNLQLYLKKTQEMNKYNLMLIIDYLKDTFKINFTDKDIEELFKKEGTVNNVEISKMLVKLGYCNNINEAFKCYISPAKKETHMKKREFSVYEYINIIKKADGIPVLAHNYQLKKDYVELREYIADLKKHGLMGLECYHSGFKRYQMLNSIDLAKRYGLLITGGSDYHGPNVKPDIELGKGRNNNLDIQELSIEKYLNKKLKY